MIYNKDMPAFPQPNKRDNPQVIGLSKREYFAGLALQGLLSNPKLDIHTTPMNIIARDSVALADALLTELSTPQP